MRKKQAFTLIELLVVIAILAILIAILLPVSFKALEMSKRSRCASNLRSLGAAFTSYATDHNGEMPHNKALPPATGSFTEVTQFRIIITNVCQLGYVTDLGLWVCPSDTEDYQGKQVRPATDLASLNSIGNCSYMYISGYHLLRTAETPSVAPLMCDESNDRELGSATPGNMPDLTADDNHGANIRNVLFLDGHVVTFKDADAANAIFDNLKNSAVICSVD